MVNPTQLEVLANICENHDIQVIGINRGYKRNGEADAMLKKEALELAKMADVVVYCFGLDELSESEGMDRTHMRIPQNQIELLEALMQTNSNIVGLLSAGAAVEMPLGALLQGDPARLSERSGRSQCYAEYPYR